MADAVLIGLDTGTTHVKALALTAGGQEVAVEAADTPVRRLEGGGAEYDPEALWDALAGCLRRLAARLGGREVLAVACASMAEAGVLLGPDDKPLYPIIAWFDPRTVAHEERLVQAWGALRLFRATGLSPQHKWTLPKLLWMRDHLGSLERAKRWLWVADYIGFRLSGEAATETTLASRSQFYDVRRGSWYPALVAASGLAAAALPPVLPSGTRFGAVTPAAAAATGLPAGTPVATGGHDHLCAAVAVGAASPGQFLDSTGTAESLLGFIDRPILTRPALAMDACYTRGPNPGTFALQAGLSTSGAAVEWLRGLLGLDYQGLLAAAQEAGEGPTGLLFHPELVRGAALSGLHQGTGAPHLVKGVLEGVAFEVRRQVEAMEALLGTRFPVIRLTGGAARNPLWLSIRAAVLGRPLELPEASEATARGAACLAARALGLQMPPAPLRQRLEAPPGLQSAYAEVYGRYLWNLNRQRR